METQRIQGQLLPCEIGRSLMGLVHLLWRLACCRPGRNCPVSFRLQSLCLFLKRVVSFSVLVSTPDFLLQQSLLFPWCSHELMWVPEARVRICTLSSTLTRGKTPHPWHVSLLGMDLLSLACCGQPAVTCCHRLVLRVPPSSLGWGFSLISAWLVL